MSELSVKRILDSEDPLSPESIAIILNFREENEHIDYKVAFAYGEDREWLNITKDFLAFANTDGGFLVFGVADRTFDKVGMELKSAEYLSDVNNIQQKINRYISPPITNFRAKHVKIEEKDFV